MFYSRKSPRMKNFDYSTPTSYFITICTYEKVCLFGRPEELNDFGRIVKDAIESIPLHYACTKIEKYVVMPNHVHMLTLLSGENRPNLSSVVGSFKSNVSQKIHQTAPDLRVWQRSFHDHVIRTEEAWQKIWKYIDENPYHWDEDCYYSS